MGGEKESVIVLLLMIFKVMKSAHCYQMDACFITDILSIHMEITIIFCSVSHPMDCVGNEHNALAGVCVSHHG